ncbi:MAG: RtcB family protein [bacterium]|nr:RtcB family protein [bacterium]
MIGVKEITGKHNKAIVYTGSIEGEVEDQIRIYLDEPGYGGTQIRVMPDVHLGKGTVIGFTATLPEQITPHTIGGDIGCGVSAWKLGRVRLSADKLDKFVRKRIPFGTETFSHSIDKEELEEIYRFLPGTFSGLPFNAFWKELHRVCGVTGLSKNHVLRSFGTLGSGNHFIEIDKDEDKNFWLVIHSGSRRLGFKIAEYHQEIAVRCSKPGSSLKFLEDQQAESYLQDMKLAQDYARLNRKVMGARICRKFFKLTEPELESIDSVHNYISFADNIVRKGAISAHKNEKVIIPFSMADGAVVGLGKGNREWNFSAPHGSGRKLARKKAKKSLNLDQYRRAMKGVWTSCIGKETLDESPMAYKKAANIIAALSDTVDIQQRLLPVYNFKAN